jgi:hypothetical protein
MLSSPGAVATDMSKDAREIFKWTDEMFGKVDEVVSLLLERIDNAVLVEGPKTYWSAHAGGKESVW